MNTPSIRRRLITRLTIGSLLLAVLAEASLYFYLRGELIEQYDSALAAKARAVAGILETDESSPQALARIAASMRTFRAGARHSDYFQLWDHEENVIMRSPSLLDADLPRAPRWAADDPRSDTYPVALPENHNGQATELRIPITSSALADGSPIWLTLVVATDDDELDETLLSLALALLVSSIVIVVGTVAIVVYGVRDGLRPLRTLSRTVSRIEADTLTRRIATDDLPSELQTIGNGLNALLARLEAAFNRERRFNADVAHELRTPLSELRSIAEVAIKWPPDSAGHARNYANVLQSATRMTDLVNALFSVVRFQSGKQSLTLEPTPLHEAIMDAWNPHAQQAGERGLTFEMNVAHDLSVPADRTILVALLRNLLANAAAYSTVNTSITCNVVPAFNGIDLILVIANHTDALTVNDLPYLDEPFWRKDSARTGSDHSGLGLTLVRQYAGALGIRCNFTLRQPNLFGVELVWPGALASPASDRTAAAANDAAFP